jgi:hypothetical protein
LWAGQKCSAFFTQGRTSARDVRYSERDRGDEQTKRGYGETDAIDPFSDIGPPINDRV